MLHRFLLFQDMRTFACLRRLRRGAVIFPRRSCLAFTAVFVGFLALISLLHHAQLLLEPTHEHTEPKHGQPQPKHEHPQPKHQRPQPKHEHPQPKHQRPQPKHEHPQPKHQRPQPKHIKCYSVNSKGMSEHRSAGIWPRVYETEDRIQLQLAYTLAKPATKTKLIFTDTTPTFEYGTFENDRCAVDQCRFSVNAGDAKKADVIIATSLFTTFFATADPRRQITMLYELEAPFHTSRHLEARVNWTATYRVDSTIVTPYEKFVFFDNFTKLPEKPSRNYALGKNKQVAWFVSNCGDWNGRLAYAQELARDIEVDVYGMCGTMDCPRDTQQFCYSLLKRRYKFYLAFENSNCRDYITEKLYWNAFL